MFGKTHALVLCLLAINLTAPATRTSADGLKVNDPFPDLTQFKLEGKLPDLTKGHVLLVDFWATWCSPCKASFPALDRLHSQYSERGLLIVAISVDEKQQDVERFLRKIPIHFTVIRDVEQELVATAKVTTMPTSFLIDREGRVRFIHNGYRGGESDRQYAREIEQLLAAPGKSP
ncbi:MAG: TlpA family protein disulfide reductase [Verrucomicrobia bacterium]|nr:TlpA family protein disulfide reductase [Verrucomicrobiota bacterium]